MDLGPIRTASTQFSLISLVGYTAKPNQPRRVQPITKAKKYFMTLITYTKDVEQFSPASPEGYQSAV